MMYDFVVCASYILFSKLSKIALMSLLNDAVFYSINANINTSV